MFGSVVLTAWVIAGVVFIITALIVQSRCDAANACPEKLVLREAERIMRGAARELQREAALLSKSPMTSSRQRA